jgi:hypothetical protein
MGASKEIFAIIREELFNEIHPTVRQGFTHIEVREANEWEEHKDDEMYVKLKKAERKAKKDLQTYLYDKRNNNFKNR